MAAAAIADHASITNIERPTLSFPVVYDLLGSLYPTSIVKWANNKMEYKASVITRDYIVWREGIKQQSIESKCIFLETLTPESQ